MVPQEVKDAVEQAKEDILAGDVTIETSREAIGR